MKERVILVRDRESIKKNGIPLHPKWPINEKNAIRIKQDWIRNERRRKFMYISNGQINKVGNGNGF